MLNTRNAFLKIILMSFFDLTVATGAVTDQRDLCREKGTDRQGGRGRRRPVSNPVLNIYVTLSKFGAIIYIKYSIVCIFICLKHSLLY